MRLLEILIMTLAGVYQGVRQDFNLLEVALIAGGWWAWKKGWRPRYPAWLRVPQAWLRHPALTALGLVAGAIALRLALIPVLPVPFPLVSDEFSHLLLADTLAHGRLANPTPAFWQHFESLHIIQQPHYVSNYFPGQALFLAAGQVALHSRLGRRAGGMRVLPAGALLGAARMDAGALGALRRAAGGAALWRSRAIG